MGQDVPNDNSNIGKTGVDSIRLGGMKIDNLPIREGAVTAEQMPQKWQEEKENKIEAIRAKYPKQSAAWVHGATRECEATITNVRKLKDDQNVMITDYSGHISLCAFRDTELARLDADKDKDEIKSLKLRFPPYDVKAMKTQIRLCKEAIVRSDIVIDKEHNDISRFKELLTQIHQRDRELKELGVIVG